LKGLYLCWATQKKNEKTKKKNVIAGIRNNWKGEEIRAEIEAVADSVTKGCCRQRY